MSMLHDTTPSATAAALPSDLAVWPETLAAVVQDRDGGVAAYLAPECGMPHAREFTDPDYSQEGCLTVVVSLNWRGRPYAGLDWWHSEEAEYDHASFQADGWDDLAVVVAAKGPAAVPGLPWNPGLPEHSGHAATVLRDAAAVAATAALGTTVNPDPASAMSVLGIVAGAADAHGTAVSRPAFATARKHRPEDPASWPATASEHVRLADRERWVLRAVDPRRGSTCGCWKAYVDLAPNSCRFVVCGDYGPKRSGERATARDLSEWLRDWPDVWNERTDGRRDHPSHRARVLRDARRLLDDWSRSRAA